MQSTLRLLAALLTFTFLQSVLAFNEPKLSKYQVFLSRENLVPLAEKFEVVKHTPLFSEVIVPENDLAIFQKLAPGSLLLQDDITAYPRKAYSKSRTTENETGYRYHSFAEVQDILKKMNSDFSEITQLVQYGKTAKNLPLVALRIGKELSSSNEKSRPRLLFTAATHGDEIITTEVLLSLMNTFLSRAKSEPRFQSMLENFELVFIPVLNPDGFTRQYRYEGNQDPNRSYSFPKDPQRKPTPSIAAEISFVQKYPIAGSIDFHAYSGVIIYPWGYTETPLASAPLKTFHDLSAKMAATNDYHYGSIADIMYIAQGSSCDYFHWTKQSISIGIELGDDKSPDPSEFAKYIQEQEESTWIFIESFKP